jgi:hypothetical protein
MPILDPGTVLALAMQCSPVQIDPKLVLAIARVESGLNTEAKHVNSNGTVDRGLMQVNSANFSWLGLDDQSALDPCQSIRAGVRVLTSLSSYNTGKPTAGIDNGYVAHVVGAYRNAFAASLRAHEVAAPADPPQPVCDALPTDTWGQEACREAEEQQLSRKDDNQ